MEAIQNSSAYSTRLFVLLLLFTAGCSAEYDTVYACEGTTLTLQCGQGELIELVRANFGRFSITICNKLGNTDWSVNCMSPKSLRVLQKSCGVSNNCSVDITATAFGDSCPGTLKYIEVHYKCVSATSTTSTQRPQPPWHALYPDPSIWLQGPDLPDDTQNLPKTNSSSTTRPPAVVPEHPEEDAHHEHGEDQGESVEQENELHRDVEDADYSQDNSNRVNTDKISDAKDGAQNEEVDMSVNVTTQSTTTAYTSTTTTRTPYSGTTWEPFRAAMTGAPQSSVDTSSAPPTVEDFAAARMCGATSASGLLWPATAAGQLAVLSCPGAGHARWRCQTSASWTAAGPDLSECRSRMVSALEQRLLGGERTLRVAAELVQLSRPTAPLLAGDVRVVSRMLSQLATRLARQLVDGGLSGRRARRGVALQLTKSVVRAASHLLHADHRAAWHQLRDEERRRAATTLLIGLEQVAFLLADYIELDRSVVEIDSNICLTVLNAGSQRYEYFQFPLASPANEWNLKGNSLMIPRASIPTSFYSDSIKLVFFMYSGLGDILLPESSTSSPSTVPYSSADAPVKRVVNSLVMSTSLGEGRHVPLTEPITMIFKHLITDNVSNPSCSFWDYTVSSWSSEGCWVSDSNHTHTACQCNHLTNFALLMDLRPPAPPLDARSLRVVVYVGFAAAVLCLSVTLVCLLVTRGLPSGDRCSLQKHQLVSLLAAELCLLVGVQVAGGSAVCCGVLAGLSQFWLLAVFSWQLLDALQLYAQLFELECSAATRLRCCYAAGYGLPLLVVAISCVVDTSSYGSNKHCWLRADNYFILSFAVPAAIAVTICAVVLALSGYVLLQHYTAAITVQTKERSRLSYMRGWLRSCLMMLLLLLLVFCLALSFLELKTPLLAYLFSASNVLLGVYIVSVMLVQNDTVREELENRGLFPSCMQEKKSLSRRHNHLCTSSGTINTMLNASDRSNLPRLWPVHAAAGGDLKGGTLNSLRSIHGPVLTAGSLRRNTMRSSMPTKMRNNTCPRTDISSAEPGLDSGHSTCSEHEESPQLVFSGQRAAGRHLYDTGTALSVGAGGGVWLPAGTGYRSPCQLIYQPSAAVHDRSFASSSYHTYVEVDPEYEEIGRQRSPPPPPPAPASGRSHHPENMRYLIRSPQSAALRYGDPRVYDESVAVAMLDGDHVICRLQPHHHMTSQLSES